MFFRTGEAALPRGFIFPGFITRDRSAQQRQRTGAPRRTPDDDNDEATGVESANAVYMRSLVVISTL